MKIEIIRHSLSHMMATAVQELFPGVKLGIGPAIENGFYYDFDLKKSFTPEDLPIIEKKMKQIIQKDVVFKKKTISKEEAKKLFKDQPYKLELIEELPDQKVSIYESGKFVDLCRGPHIKSSKEIPKGSFKLVKIAGAYWRGSEKRPMLQRIYGLAFASKKELDNFLKLQEESEKRDHRKLGKELDLFSIKEEVGPGLVLWHPKGSILRGIIEDFWRKEHEKRGYQYVYTPHIANLDLWKQSGHTDFYQENMYPAMRIDEVDYQLKPMNCLAHVHIYKDQIRSYRDLPIRYCELGTVYRYEKSGVLHGILRPRGFTQDDSHIFCSPDQISEEVEGVLDFTVFLLSTFGFKKYETDLSVRDPKSKSKYLGDDKVWQKAEKALEYVLKKKKIKYRRVEGEAVFYGPKIDIKLVDAIGRPWQGPTIQVDFNFPEKFDLNFVNRKGRKQRVVMIHRTILGSMERFVGVLIEHYGGALPFWLAPVQIYVIPVGSMHQKYALEIAKELNKEGLRVELKDEAETVSKKIREGEMQKIPYLLVVGDKEIKGKSVRIRERQKGDIGIMKTDKFIKGIKDKIKNKK